MNRRFTCLALPGLCLTCMAALVAVPATAAPRPELVPRTWQFKFTHSMPKPIAVEDDAGVLKWYWYLSYKVVNDTDAVRQFLPDISIATDQGDIIKANRRTPARVFRVIKKAARNKLLVSPIEAVAKIKPGEDQARQSVAIWPAFHHDVDVLNVFIAGLSGETARVFDPRTGEPVVDPQSLKPQFDPRTGESVMDAETGTPKIEPRPLLLRKTLMLNYLMPGSSLHPQHQKLQLKKTQWVMR